MTPDNDQLAVLRRLQSDGQITDEEYRDLARGFVQVVEDDRPAAEEPASGRHEPPVEEDPSSSVGQDQAADADQEEIPDDGAARAEAFLTPKFRENLSTNYLGLVFIASIALLVIGLLGVLSWWVSIPAILVLVTTLFDGWGKVTLVGAVTVAVLMLVSMALSVGDTTPEPVQPSTVTLPEQEPYPPIPGSLGIYMDQVTELWNTVDSQPRINKGLTRQNEIGEYDTFIYRFGDWGRLAGAYDPSNEAVYALLITGTFSAEDTDQLYVHLCYMVAPYSQECIESYHEKGLDGGGLEDFADTQHEAEWTVGDSVWRLEIAGNVLTVRVYGPDAA